ncbi:retrovirus-related pol polyprotein from transposon TNT 1-94 [Tanacetum coccineum]
MFHPSSLPVHRRHLHHYRRHDLHCIIHHYLPSNMTISLGEEAPAIVQLQKWEPSPLQTNLAHLCEAFLSPTREFIVVLSYHNDGLLLPLVKGEATASETGASGIREDENNQQEGALFKQLHLLVGDHGLTVHAFFLPSDGNEPIEPVPDGQNGKGVWLEWGPSTSGEEVHLSRPESVGENEAIERRWLRTFLSISVWICQIYKNSVKTQTRERMSDQEAKKSKRSQRVHAFGLHTKFKLQVSTEIKEREEMEGQDEEKKDLEKKVSSSFGYKNPHSSTRRSYHGFLDAVGQLIGCFEDKILTPELDPSPCCARCGTPVDGPSCRGCAFLRKKFDEDLLAYCVENGIFKDFQDTFEPSDDNTNVVNALREPCVVNQDPGEKSSQEPPQIDHNCCYECGDSSDGIFCRQCICKSCGKGAHYGYNCPPKVPIISNPEQCNQTINELPQILPNDHPIRNYEAENSFAYVPNPNSFYNSPNFSYPPPQNSPSFSQQYLCCAYCGGPHFDYQCQPINETCYEPNPSYDYSGFNHPQPPQESVYRQEALNKILKEFEELKRDQRMLTELKKQIEEEQTVKEDMSIEEMRHEQQLVDRKIKEITNDLGIRRFRGEEIDEEYERDCEIRIRKLKQDFNVWGSEVRKKEKAYEDEKKSIHVPVFFCFLFTCNDEDDSIPLGDIIARNFTSKAITPDLPIEETDNSLNMENEHLDTIPTMESDEVIKSSVENLVPIPSEFEGISDDTCDVPNYDDNCVNVESEFMESLSNHDTSIDNSSKIDPIQEEFAGELAHIAPIPPEIVEADFDSNDDTSSDDDSFENIEYVDASLSYIKYDSLEEENEEQEEKEFDLEDILQIQDVILHEKLLNVHRTIYNSESLKD